MASADILKTYALAIRTTQWLISFRRYHLLGRGLDFSSFFFLPLLHVAAAQIKAGSDNRVKSCKSEAGIFQSSRECRS